jgi:hypothetical protein
MAGMNTGVSAQLLLPWGHWAKAGQGNGLLEFTSFSDFHQDLPCHPCGQNREQPGCWQADLDGVHRFVMDLSILTMLAEPKT